MAGALTFFPPDPPLYEFERRDEAGNLLADDDDGDGAPKKNDEIDSNGSANIAQTESPDSAEAYDATHRKGETKERMQSPAQQLVDRAKDLRQQAKLRNARDTKDHKNNVQYKLKLDSRLAIPRYERAAVEAVKVPSKNGIHVAAVIYRVTAAQRGEAATTTASNGTEPAPTKRQRPPFTIIYSHGNATDIGAMFPLQAVLAHSLDCNVVMYDYSGFGESGGMPLEENTYNDIDAVYNYTLEHVANNDPSTIILYGQSVGGGPCCYLAQKNDNLGGMVLHSAFTSGMRVLTPSR